MDEMKKTPKISSFSQKTTKETVPLEALLESYIIPVESSNNPFAVNKKSGARGLTQMTSIAWEDLQRVFPEKYKNIPFKVGSMNPEISKQAGLDYLDIIDGYLEHYGFEKTVDNYLAAYNAGIGTLYTITERNSKLYKKNKKNVEANQIMLDKEESHGLK